MYNDAEKHRVDASKKAAQIVELERQLAAAKDEKSNGVGNAAGADVVERLSTSRASALGFWSGGSEALASQ